MGTASPLILKAGRILVELPQDELAVIAGISKPTLIKIERGENVEIQYVLRVQEALELLGVEFTGVGEAFGEGVRWKERIPRKPTGRRKVK
jgi:DNA-binding XRE family transcriptional regulator